jgi:hypothetical protein
VNEDLPPPLRLNSIELQNRAVCIEFGDLRVIDLARMRSIILRRTAKLILRESIVAEQIWP